MAIKDGNSKLESLDKNKRKHELLYSINVVQMEFDDSNDSTVN